MDADQQGRRFTDVFPAVDFHPEPIIHQQIPEELLLLHRLLVLTAEIPFARPFGHPSAHPAGFAVTLILHRGAGLLSLQLRLLAHLGSPVIAITHSPELPRLARVEPEPAYGRKSCRWTRRGSPSSPIDKRVMTVWLRSDFPGRRPPRRCCRPWWCSCPRPDCSPRPGRGRKHCPEPTFGAPG